MDDTLSSLIPHRGRIRTNKEELVIHYRINFKYVCLCTVSIPLGALLVCLVSAYIFQFDDVHETHCRVFNIIPSISAVTGVSPQRYIWRISVALHIGPRVIISAVYNAYQLSMINPSAEQDVKYKAQLWLNIAYLLNLIEAGALCGVSYISNRENYPIHEKLFITFMVSSLTHMVACIQGTKIAAETRKDLESVKASLKYKKDLLVLSLLCTAGLIIFFLQHRFFCFRMAFSMFALCEYIIAAANMAFHISVILDFPTEELMVGKFIVPTNKDCSGDVDVTTQRNLKKGPHNWKHVWNELHYKEFQRGTNSQLDIFNIWRIFPFEVFSNVDNISIKCQLEHKKHLNGALRNELNSLKLFDATAKLPSGILRGNINQYGDFDECLEVPNAQYCLVLMDLESLWKKPLSRYQNLVHAHFSIKETFNDPAHRIPGFTFVRWGFCIPIGCTGDDLTNALTAKFGIKAKVRPNMCQAKNRPVEKPSYAHYLARGYFILILFVVGVATFLHRKSNNDTSHGNICVQLLMTFAIQKNYKQLTALTKNRNEYHSLHGIRCLSALSLLMAHKTMASLYNPYINKTWMAEMQAMKWSVLGRNAIIYTDCFLLISGLLNANALLIELEKHQRMKFKEKLVNRLFRIFPGMITVILFCTYILPYMGSGPLWPIVINHHSELCSKYMWRNLLFIHNYFGFESMCLTHTHQIGIDMQLFLMTPVFVYTLWNWKKGGLWIIGATSIISMILRFYTTFYYNLSHVVHFGIPISRMFDTADYSYILPTHRATIYLIGLTLAYLLRNPHKASYSKKKLFCIWTSVYLVGFTTWFAPMAMSIKEYEYNSFEAALYGALYPFTWGVPMAWIIYATENGFGTWFTSILTWKYFQIFTRIAYGIYLIQFPVFFYNVGITRHVGEYKNYMMLPPVETACILLLATMLTLFVEMPFQNMYKLILATKKRAN